MWMAAMWIAGACAWFLAHAWRGIFVQLQGDDLMNLYQAWTLPLPRLTIANLTPFTDVYRPLGAACYRILYWWAGLDPLPYRLFAYSLMLANIGLVYALVRRLGGSSEVAGAASLVYSFHPNLLDIYLNNGTIYDVLCATFTLSALLVYTGGEMTWRRWIAFLALLTAALNSKEMAAAVPALLLAYELIFYRWTRRGHLIACAVSAVIVLLAFKLKTASSSFAGIPDYAMEFSVTRYFWTSRLLVSEAVYQFGPTLNDIQVAAILAGMFALAALLRSRILLFAAIFATVAPLPINFIPPRGFFVMYLPMAGWAIFAAALVAALHDRIPWKIAKTAPVRYAVLIVAFAGLAILFARGHFRTFNDIDASQHRNRTMIEDLARIEPAMPKGARVLFLNDDFDPGVWDPLYIVRLGYRDPSIEIVRVKVAGAPADLRAFHRVFDFVDGHYVRR